MKVKNALEKSKKTKRKNLKLLLEQLVAERS